eukprot:scaffold1943_cov343-Pavlova_lutheri.AAC.6
MVEELDSHILHCDSLLPIVDPHGFFHDRPLIFSHGKHRLHPEQRAGSEGFGAWFRSCFDALFFLLLHVQQPSIRFPCATWVFSLASRLPPVEGSPGLLSGGIGWVPALGVEPGIDGGRQMGRD